MAIIDGVNAWFVGVAVSTKLVGMSVVSAVPSTLVVMQTFAETETWWSGACFCPKIFLGHQKFLARKNCGPSIFFESERFFVHDFLCVFWNIFASKKMVFVGTNFWVKRILVWKEFLVNKDFWFKKLLVPKILWV